MQKHEVILRPFMIACERAKANVAPQSVNEIVNGVFAEGAVDWKGHLRSIANHIDAAALSAHEARGSLDSKMWENISWLTRSPAAYAAGEVVRQEEELKGPQRATRVGRLLATERQAIFEAVMELAPRFRAVIDEEIDAIDAAAAKKKAEEEGDDEEGVIHFTPKK